MDAGATEGPADAGPREVDQLECVTPDGDKTNLGPEQDESILPRQDKPILPRQDTPVPQGKNRGERKKNDKNKKWKYAYPEPMKNEGEQWRRSGNTGWARWAMTYYNRPDGKKAQKRRYIGYMGDAALDKIYKLIGRHNGKGQD